MSSGQLQGFAAVRAEFQRLVDQAAKVVAAFPDPNGGPVAFCVRPAFGRALEVWASAGVEVFGVNHGFNSTLKPCFRSILAAFSSPSGVAFLAASASLRISSKWHFLQNNLTLLSSIS